MANVQDAARHLGVQQYAFFQRLMVRDGAVQKQMISTIAQEFQDMMDQDDVAQLAQYYAPIKRLARDAPFPTMREAFTDIATTLDDKFPQLASAKRDHRVSYFIEASEIELIADNQDEELSALFRYAFLLTGRIDNFVQLLAWHKSYLQLFQSSIASIMLRDGTLPLQWRSYIAVMAASELRCHYLADVEQYYFIVNGGEVEWLQGIDYVSPKLFRLHELSSLLAHRPWIITEAHIADLLASDQEDSWSVSELVHAIIVLCKFHSMSSIALGLGCAEEEDLSVFSELGSQIDGESTLRFPYNPDTTQPIDVASSCGSLSDQDLSTIDRDDQQLLRRLKSGSHDGSDTADDEDDDEEAAVYDARGSLETNFEDECVFEVAEDSGMSSAGSSRRKDTLWRFCGGSVLRYADFDVRSEEYSVLHTEDFSWDEHCFSLVKRYFPGEAGQILEDLFNLTGKLTYDYFGTQREESVDTSPYRSAVWYYVHRIFGICHDDYDYRQVNIYLNLPTKIFIKKVACTPWKVRKEDFEHFDRTLGASEKCHVTLIVAEARKQAGLMYGLRAVMKHMR